MMKGVSLPINVIVIIVIAMIVLLAIIALFMGVWDPDQLAMEAAKNNACNMLVSTGCEDTDDIKLSNYDATGDGNIDDADTLTKLCEKYDIYDKTECAQKLCKCK